VEVTFHAYVEFGGKWSVSRSGCFTASVRPLVLINIRLGELRSRSGSRSGEKMQCPSGVQKPAVQPVITARDVTKSFRTGRLERELQVVQVSATICTCIATLWVSLVSFVATTLCVSFQRVFIRYVFRYNSVRKLLDTPSYWSSEVRFRPRRQRI
jgi:hypothetical protein